MTLRPPARLCVGLAARALTLALLGAASGPAFAEEKPSALDACLDAEFSDPLPDLLEVCLEAAPLAETDEARSAVAMALALSYLAADDMAQGRAAADKAVALWPSPAAYMVQGVLAFRAGDPAAARASAEAGLRLAPRDSDLVRLRVLARAEAGEHGALRADLERLHRLDPADAAVTQALLKAYIARGDSRAADDLIARAQAGGPAPGLLVIRAEGRYLRQDWTGTISDLDAVIALHPLPYPHALRGLARARLGDEAGAWTDLEAVGAPGTVNGPTAVIAALVAQKLGLADLALGFIEVALAVAQPADRPTLLIRRAQLLSDQGDLDGARAAAEEALRLAPDFADAWRAWGLILRGTDAAAALEAFRRAAALSPRDDGIALDLAYAVEEAGDLKGAEAAFRRLLARHPADPLVLTALATNLLRQGRGPEALALSRRAFALAPDDAEVLIVHGEALFTQGQLEAALQMTDRMATLDADTAYSRLLAAVARRQLGQYEAALREADAGLAFAPDDAALMKEKGVVYYQLDDLLSALDWAQKALAADPRNAEALYLRGLVREEMGESAAAAADIAAAIALDPALADPS